MSKKSNTVLRYGTHGTLSPRPDPRALASPGGVKRGDMPPPPAYPPGFGGPFTKAAIKRSNREFSWFLSVRRRKILKELTK